MPNETYDLFGPWISFPRPIPIPLPGSLDDASWCVIINEEWLPAVIGALKVLARPQTWDSNDPEEIAAAQREASNMLAAWQQGCAGGVIVPDWHYVINGSGLLVRLNKDITFCVPGSPEDAINSRVFFVTNASEPPEVINLMILIVENGTTIYSGANICDFTISTDLSEDLVSVHTIDCLGGFMDVGGAGRIDYADVYPDDPVKALQEVQVIAYTSSLTVTITGFGTIVCGGA